jgi:hypothetical protein
MFRFLAARLFPEEKISTDCDMVGVVKKYGNEMISELKKRLDNSLDEKSSS